MMNDGNTDALTDMRAQFEVLRKRIGNSGTPSDEEIMRTVKANIRSFNRSWDTPGIIVCGISIAIFIVLRLLGLISWIPVVLLACLLAMEWILTIRINSTRNKAYQSGNLLDSAERLEHINEMEVRLEKPTPYIALAIGAVFVADLARHSSSLSQLLGGQNAASLVVATAVGLIAGGAIGGLLAVRSSEKHRWRRSEIADQIRSLKG